MSWNPLDDNFFESPRVIAAGLELEEIAIYLNAETYSGRHLTDGLVPVQLLLWRPSRSLGKDPIKVIEARKQSLQRLIDSGFLADRPNDMVEVLGYLDNHDSKAEVEEKRRKISEIRSAAGHAGGIVSGQVRAQKNAEANTNRLAVAKIRSNEPPLLSDPLLSSPHRSGEKAPKAFSPGEFQTHTSAQPDSALGSPPPRADSVGPSAASPAVRLVPKWEARSLTQSDWPIGIGRELKTAGWSNEVIVASNRLASMLDSGVECVASQSELDEYSRAIQTIEKNGMLSRDDLTAAKRLLGAIVANNEPKGAVQ